MYPFLTFTSLVILQDNASFKGAYDNRGYTSILLRM